MKNKDYTGLTLRKETKEKLNEFKGDNSYEKAIDTLLDLAGGTLLDDIKEIKRQQVAFELTTILYSSNGDTISSYSREDKGITFKELSQSEVGDKFYSPEMNNMYYYSEWAEIIFKDENSVLVRVTCERQLPTSFTEDVNMLHISLF